MREKQQSKATPILPILSPTLHHFRELSGSCQREDICICYGSWSSNQPPSSSNFAQILSEEMARGLTDYKGIIGYLRKAAMKEGNSEVVYIVFLIEKDSMIPFLIDGNRALRTMTSIQRVRI